MGKIYMDFFTKIIKSSSDQNALDQCLIEFNTEIWKSIETASLPLLKISQAITTVRLDASEELMPMLVRLKALTEDFNNEWQKALSTFSKTKKVCKIWLQWDKMPDGKKFKLFQMRV